MRRKTKRAFRYLFPVTVLITCTLLFTTKSKNNSIEKNSTEKECVIEGHGANTSAKSLSLVSHNPQNATKLQISAVDAVQLDDGEMNLHNPYGVLENKKGLSSLISNEAIYDADNRKVKFYENVNFTHFSGLVATTSSATLDTKTQDISGENKIKARHNNNLITANTFEFQKAGNVIVFNGNVCLNVVRK